MVMGGTRFRTYLSPRVLDKLTLPGVMVSLFSAEPQDQGQAWGGTPGMLVTSRGDAVVFSLLGKSLESKPTSFQTGFDNL